MPELSKDAEKVPANYMREVLMNGLQNVKPPITFDYSQWPMLAQAKLPATAWHYVNESAGTRETENNNRSAFRKWGLIPNRLTGSQLPDMSVEVLGVRYPFPIAMAPIGVLSLFHSDKEHAFATAASKVGVPYTYSTAASVSLEEAAESCTGEHWFQLYWPANKDNDITASILSRAQKSGYRVLVVTLDTFTLGWRPMDLDLAYHPVIKADDVGSALGFTDPVFQKKFQALTGRSVQEDKATAALLWSQIAFPGSQHGWEDLKFLREHWKGPIVLKGILSTHDAQKAVEHGIDGIVVSNHGGRQADGMVSSLDALGTIVEAVGSKVDVLFDSGVRCGADITKALAMGAKMVLIGRPLVYGLTIGGSDGVVHVLRALLGELNLTLHLNGYSSLAPQHLNRSVLARITS